MTGRATFGDFADATTRHLNQLPQSGTARRQMARSVVQVDETTRGARAIVQVMARYGDDIDAVIAALPDRNRRHLRLWVYAARRTREALAGAAGALQITSPDDAWVRLSLAPGESAGPLDAAAATMLLGRDLLHTHLHSRPGGGTQARSDWAAVVTSIPVTRAVLHHLAGWARQIAPYGSHAAVTGQRGTTAQRRQLSTACQCLSTLAWAVDAAHEQQPVRASDLHLLHAVPVNELARPHHPAGNDHVGDLCAGIVSTAERVRAAARLSAVHAAWSPALTRESLRQAADYSTVISWNCHLILQTLAGHPAADVTGKAGSRLANAANYADHARAAWLRAAEAWDTITTDTRGRISRTTRDTADLALWTGRLAYADPHWTPELGPSHATRQPGQLLAEPQNLADLVDAVHHASHATARLASDTLAQLHTAAATGRLVVPTRRLPAQFDVPYRFAQAPRPCAQPLLDAYAAASAASEQATAAVAQVAAAVQAPSRVLTTIRAAGRATPGEPYTGNRHAPGAQAARHPVIYAPGPAERTLLDLDITDPQDLTLAATLDKAVDQLLIRAASDPDTRTPREPGDQSSGTAELISHLLTSSGDRLPGTSCPRGTGSSQDLTPPAARASAATTFPASLTAARQARTTVRATLTEWGLTALTDDAELLTSELVANAFEHGEGPIGLSVSTSTLPSGRTAITCEVTDQSPDLPAPGPADPECERGRGLAIVTATAWAKGITLQPRGKTISFTLTQPPDPDRHQAQPERQAAD
jgi:anti-sigma regulatory factor (Ser/Thr protein kinase)